MPKHPLDHPFAWALVRPDGADTADAARRRRRVDRRHAHRAAGRAPVGRRARGPHQRPRPAWCPRTTESPDGRGHAARRRCASVELVRSVRTPAQLDYRYTAGDAQLAVPARPRPGKIIGQRCPVCGKVYVPPRGACPDRRRAHHRARSSWRTPAPSRRSASSTCSSTARRWRSPTSARLHPARRRRPVDHAPHPGDRRRPTCGIGMRVEAVWVPDERAGRHPRVIKWFRPTGEPDVARRHPR